MRETETKVLTKKMQTYMHCLRKQQLRSFLRQNNLLELNFNKVQDNYPYPLVSAMELSVSS